MWRWLFILALAWAANPGYERDAYQAHLRQHPAQQGALRFDVQWRMRSRARERLTLRMEILSGGSGSAPVTTLQSEVTPPRFRSRWSSLLLTGEEFQKLGTLGAWRATLWDGSTLLAEQKSFLW
jgi:hypothetical protein